MFRAIDRDHMLWRADLWDYASVKAAADDIRVVLRRDPPGFMPTPEFGGPWPEQWIQVFEAWIAAGHPRLPLAKGTYDVVRLGNRTLQLAVSIPLANGADNAWIDREQAPDSTRAYIVLRRPAPAGAVQPARVMQHVEDLTDPQIAEIVITDTDGRRSLTLPA
jgi:hypothetical protein